MLKKTFTQLYKISVLTVVTNIILYLFLVLAYSIPMEGELGSRIRSNVELSLFTWENENESPLFDNKKIFWHTVGEDQLMINIAIQSSGNPFYDAAANMVKIYSTDENERYDNLIGNLYYPQDGDSIPYSHYYGIVSGIYRILLIFYQIKEIRLLLYYIGSVLTLYTIHQLSQTFGWNVTIPFIVAIISRHWILHTISLETLPDISLSLLGMLTIILMYKLNLLKSKSEYVFLILGILSFAISYMASPLLTLGMPLIILVLLYQNDDNSINSWLIIIRNSVYWCLGYSSSILSKNIIARIAGVPSNTGSHILYYLGENYTIKDRFIRVWYCIMAILTPLKISIPLLICTTFIIFTMYIKYGIKITNYSFQLLFISAYPLVWSFIIAEHSIHFYASNFMSIFVFGIGCTLCLSVKHNSVRPKVNSV